VKRWYSNLTYCPVFSFFPPKTVSIFTLKNIYIFGKKKMVAWRYQRVVSERYTSPNQNSTRSKEMETGDEMFVGHLRSFSVFLPFFLPMDHGSWWWSSLTRYQADSFDAVRLQNWDKAIFFIDDEGRRDYGSSSHIQRNAIVALDENDSFSFKSIT